MGIYDLLWVFFPRASVNFWPSSSRVISADRSLPVSGQLWDSVPDELKYYTTEFGISPWWCNWRAQWHTGCSTNIQGWWQDLWVSTYYKGDDLKKWKFPSLSPHTHTRKEHADVCFIFHASLTFCAEDKSHQLHPNILILFHRSLLQKGFSNSFWLSREVGVYAMLSVWRGIHSFLSEGTHEGNNNDTDGGDHIWT